jgi:hypothetical protein
MRDAMILFSLSDGSILGNIGGSAAAALRVVMNLMIQDSTK